jgi:hypothetical protein
MGTHKTASLVIFHGPSDKKRRRMAMIVAFFDLSLFSVFFLIKTRAECYKEERVGRALSRDRFLPNPAFVGPVSPIISLCCLSVLLLLSPGVMCDFVI